MKSLSWFKIAIGGLGILASALAYVGCRPQVSELRLATTTSTVDSGLLSEILPVFEEAHNAAVDVVAVGTGQALALGRSGDVDVVLVHARSLEEEFVVDGYGLERVDVMYNDFVLLGPIDDPAGIRGELDVATALTKIREAGATFVSRGDGSGTHVKEQSLWEAAGITPEGDWYHSVGQGMGSTLTVADEVRGYTITDRGTFIRRQAEGLELVILLDGDERLTNPYSVIAVNPDLHEGIDVDLAQEFIAWLVSAETQADINSYRVSGQQLFFGNAGP